MGINGGVFLPLGAILSTSLITQIEYKNNTWKQLHTLPLTYTDDLFFKASDNSGVDAAVFVLFNIGNLSRGRGSVPVGERDAISRTAAAVMSFS